MSVNLTLDRFRSLVLTNKPVVGASVSPTVLARRAWLTLGIAICLWVWVFGGLALARHSAGGTHAEDLGFTDQVIWNFLRGQWFRMTVYQGATWNTEVDVTALARPDSLLAFHVEPMLLLFAPIYALGGDARALLVLQALALALGAVPAYRLGARWAGVRWAGVVVAVAYLLSPLGQWAALADFHTTALAAPLLLLALERWSAGHVAGFIAASLLAMTAREDVALAVVGLGVVAVLSGWRRPGLLLIAVGMVASLACLMIFARYGSGVPTFASRYPVLAGPPTDLLEALLRPQVREYAATLWLSGGWLAWLTPLTIIPALPGLALNVFSSSPWMAAGKAHYSVLVLPFVVAGAAGGLGCVARWQTTLQARRVLGARWLLPLAGGALVFTSGLGYLRAGAGPLAANYAPLTVTDHAVAAAEMMALIPPGAGVSASSQLVPHLSHRASVYVFPAIEDADLVFLDVTNSAGISAGDLYQRVGALLAGGGWEIEHARDGLLLLGRRSESPPTSVADLPAEFYSFVRVKAPLPTGDSPGATRAEPRARFLNGSLALRTAWLGPSPLGTITPEGPTGVLHTTWRTSGPLPQWVWPKFRFDLGDGRETNAWDLAALWWYPPERWLPEDEIRIDVPNIPLHALITWAASVEPPGDQGFQTVEAILPTRPLLEDASVRLGELTLQVGADPWQLQVLGPDGSVIWQEASDQPLSFQAADGARWRATRLLSATPLDAGAVRFLAATDDPSGRVLAVEAHSLGPRVFRLTVVPSESAAVRSVGGAILATTDEQFVGLGERFTSVNQRGHLVDVWAEDRVLAGYGDSTYAPVPIVFSSRGYGFMLERFERSRFDLAASQPDRWTWEQDTASASFLVMYGPSLKELVQRQAEVSGTPPLPPIWAFGVWKTTTGGQDHVLHEAQRLRELDVPVSAVFAYDAVDDGANVGWPHVNYAGRWAGSYPDHAAFTTALHRLGLKALTYFKADFHLDRLGYDEPARLGFLARQVDGHPYVHPRFPVSWLDFTNSRAVDWWGRLWKRALVDLNYDGGMLDVGEILPADAYMANGRRGLESHNQYPLLYAWSAWQHAMGARPNGDFVLFARSGAVGAQQFQSIQWPGDALIRWEAPGGLRSLIPAALSFGLSGFPYWHPEVAGYLQAGLSHDDERELWLRWLQLATWTSTLRDHYGDHPTEPVDFWLDDGTIAAYREAAQIHNSLVPYLYTHAAEASRTGLPLMRFLALEAPDVPRAWSEQQSYFLGSQLLVAPVVEPSATTRTVYLPPGQWADYWTNDLYAGGEEVTVAAPLDGGRAPVFVRAGSVLPLAPAFDSLSESEHPGVRTWAGDLVVRIVPGGDGPAEFTLYDGTRLAWDGATTLRVSANARPRSVELRSPDGTVVVERITEPDGTIRTE